MKVISRPDGRDEWTLEIECRKCHAKLEVNKDDLYPVNTAVGYAGETWDPAVYVDCGNCESSINVTDKVQDGVREKLYDKLYDKLKK